MDIEYISKHSGDSKLRDIHFDGIQLVASLDMDELDIGIDIIIPTCHVFVPGYNKSLSSIGRICYLDIIYPENQLLINQNGIIIPPNNFGKLMKEIKNGYGLAYGIHINRNPRIIRFLGHRLLLACVTTNIDQVAIKERHESISQADVSIL